MYITPGEKILRDIEFDLKEEIKRETISSVAPVDPSEDGGPYYTVQQFADRLGFTSLTIYNWLKGGKLQCIQATGKWGKIRIPASELKRLAGYAKKKGESDEA